MATTLYLNDAGSLPTTSLGNGHTAMSGAADGYRGALLFGADNLSAGISIYCYTATGPTSGQEFTSGISTQTAYHWLSEPVSAAVTISGTVTFGFYGDESSMSANAAFGARIQKVSAVDFSFTDIVAAIDDAEASTSANTLHSWTATPTSVALSKGDRIRLVPYVDDAPGVTLGNGYNVYLVSNTTYKSYVTFTENFSFLTFSGSQYLYPTNTASDVATADVDYRVWTSRGT